MTIVTGDSVVQWVCEAMGMVLSPHARAIGEERDGQLIAAVTFDAWNGVNAMVHQRIERSPSRRFWWTVADYGFRHLGCQRLTGIVPADNARAIALDEHIGFDYEGRMRGAADNGQDILIYVLWRKDCRFLHWGNACVARRTTARTS